MQTLPANEGTFTVRGQSNCGTGPCISAFLRCSQATHGLGKYKPSGVLRSGRYLDFLKQWSTDYCQTISQRAATPGELFVGSASAMNCQPSATETALTMCIVGLQEHSDVPTGEQRRDKCGYVALLECGRCRHGSLRLDEACKFQAHCHQPSQSRAVFHQA